VLFGSSSIGFIETPGLGSALAVAGFEASFRAVVRPPRGFDGRLDLGVELIVFFSSSSVREVFTDELDDEKDVESLSSPDC
jgi:hypothetical protein